MPQAHLHVSEIIDTCGGMHFAAIPVQILTAASRSLIGQQIMHAEWHMFLPLMTLL